MCTILFLLHVKQVCLEETASLQQEPSFTEKYIITMQSDYLTVCFPRLEGW